MELTALTRLFRSFRTAFPGRDNEGEEESQ